VVTPPEAEPGLVQICADAALSVSVAPPQYAVLVVYKGQDRVLHNAEQVWAHVGHSGWKDTCDIQLEKLGPQVRKAGRPAAAPLLGNATQHLSTLAVGTSTDWLPCPSI
jgi:hypothetical protein